VCSEVVHFRLAPPDRFYGRANLLMRLQELTEHNGWTKAAVAIHTARLKQGGLRSVQSVGSRSVNGSPGRGLVLSNRRASYARTGRVPSRPLPSAVATCLALPRASVPWGRGYYETPSRAIDSVRWHGVSCRKASCRKPGDRRSLRPQRLVCPRTELAPQMPLPYPVGLGKGNVNAVQNKADLRGELRRRTCSQEPATARGQTLRKPSAPQ